MMGCAAGCAVPRVSCRSDVFVGCGACPSCRAPASGRTPHRGFLLSYHTGNDAAVRHPFCSVRARSRGFRDGVENTSVILIRLSYALRVFRRASRYIATITHTMTFTFASTVLPLSVRTARLALVASLVCALGTL